MLIKMPLQKKKTIICLLIITSSILIYLQADRLLQKDIDIYLAHASSIQVIDNENLNTLNSILEIEGKGLGIKTTGKTEFYGTLEFKASIVLNNQTVNQTIAKILSPPTQHELKVSTKTQLDPNLINLKLALALTSKPTVKLDFNQIIFQANIDWTITIEEENEETPISNGYGIIWEVNREGITGIEVIHQEQGSLAHIINTPYEKPTIQLRINEIINKLNIKTPIKIKIKTTIHYLYHIPKTGFKIKDKTEAEIGEITIQQTNGRTTVNLTFKTPIIEKQVKIIHPNTEAIKSIIIIIASTTTGILISTITNSKIYETKKHLNQIANK